MYTSLQSITTLLEDLFVFAVVETEATLQIITMLPLVFEGNMASAKFNITQGPFVTAKVRTMNKAEEVMEKNNNRLHSVVSLCQYHHHLSNQGLKFQTIAPIA